MNHIKHVCLLRCIDGSIFIGEVKEQNASQWVFCKAIFIIDIGSDCFFDLASGPKTKTKYKIISTPPKDHPHSSHGFQVHFENIVCSFDVDRMG